MTAWIAALCVLLALFALTLLRCKAEASWHEGAFLWRVALGPITLAPRSGKVKEVRGEDDGLQQKPEKSRGKLTPAYIAALAELALRLFRRFFRLLRIDHLRLYFTAAFDDPYDTVTAYNCAGTAMEAISALAAGRIRKLELRAETDFDRAAPQLDARVVLSARLGSLILLGISAFFGFWSIRRRMNKLTIKENEHGKSVDR